MDDIQRICKPECVSDTTQVLCQGAGDFAPLCSAYAFACSTTWIPVSTGQAAATHAVVAAAYTSGVTAAQATRSKSPWAL